MHVRAMYKILHILFLSRHLETKIPFLFGEIMTIATIGNVNVYLSFLCWS